MLPIFPRPINQQNIVRMDCLILMGLFFFQQTANSICYQKIYKNQKQRQNFGFPKIYCVFFLTCIKEITTQDKKRRIFLIGLRCC